MEPTSATNSCWVCGSIHTHTDLWLKMFDKDTCKSVFVLMKVLKLNLTECTAFLEEQNLSTAFCPSCSPLINEGITIAKEQDLLQDRMQSIQSKLGQSMNLELEMKRKLRSKLTGENYGENGDIANASKSSESSIRNVQYTSNDSVSVPTNSTSIVEMDQVQMQNGHQDQEPDMRQPPLGEENIDQYHHGDWMEKEHDQDMGRNDNYEDTQKREYLLQQNHNDESNNDDNDPSSHYVPDSLDYEDYSPSYSEFTSASSPHDEFNTESDQKINLEERNECVIQISDNSNEDENGHDMGEGSATQSLSPRDPPEVPCTLSYDDGFHHSTNYIYACVICNIFCMNSRGLGDHYSNAHPNGPWNCTECHVICTSQRKLYAHRSYVHNFPRSLPIPQPFIAADEEEEDVKIMPHLTPQIILEESTPHHPSTTGEGNDSTSVPQDLQRPFQLKIKNERKKIWKCSECHSTFRHGSKLTTHRRKIHKGKGLRKNGPPAGIMCLLCDKQYPSTKPLNSHYKSEHPNTEWKCRICQRVFPRMEGLYIHRREVHKDLPWNKKKINRVAPIIQEGEQE